MKNISDEKLQLLEQQYGCYVKILDLKKLSHSQMDYLLVKDNFSLYYVIGCTIFALLNIGANSLLIYGLFKTTKKLTLGNKLFIYLSCTDLLSGVVLMPMLIYYRTYGVNCIYMALTLFVIAYTVIADSLILLTISMVRLATIQNPLNSHNQLKKVKLMIIFQVVFALAAGSVFFYCHFYGSDVFSFQVIGVFANTCSLGLSLAILVCVSRSLLMLQRYKRSNSCIFTEAQLLNHRKSASSLLFIGLMMVMFMLIQAPMYLFLHIKLNDQRISAGKPSRESFKDTQNFMDIKLLVGQLNTITNAFVIIGRTKKIRKCLVDICR